MGKMDIAEKRIPQDGRVEMSLDGKDVDLRISILPTVYGEKIVIRLLWS
jgi:type IV pilus assembly protein PilB